MITPDNTAAELSLAEVAARLGLLQATVREAVRLGYLPPVRVVNGEPRFTPAAVAHYGAVLGRWRDDHAAAPMEC
ncbi:MAG: hypothetical protein AB7R89_28735 [Dehalococcoidia bacterium]